MNKNDWENAERLNQTIDKVEDHPIIYAMGLTFIFILMLIFICVVVSIITM